MPRFDGTGPTGMGPGTGRGAGPCGGGMGFGRGFGMRGRGRRRGWCLGWGDAPTKEEQKKDLVEYKKALEEELEAVKKEEAEI